MGPDCRCHGDEFTFVLTASLTNASWFHFWSWQGVDPDLQTGQVAGQRARETWAVGARDPGVLMEVPSSRAAPSPTEGRLVAPLCR